MCLLVTNSKSNANVSSQSHNSAQHASNYQPLLFDSTMGIIFARWPLRWTLVPSHPAVINCILPADSVSALPVGLGCAPPDRVRCVPNPLHHSVAFPVVKRLRLPVHHYETACFEGGSLCDLQSAQGKILAPTTACCERWQQFSLKNCRRPKTTKWLGPKAGCMSPRAPRLLVGAWYSLVSCRSFSSRRFSPRLRW